MIRKIKLLIAAVGAASALVPGAGQAAAQDFYQGKTVRMVVAFAPGGGFDTYSRAIARHWVDVSLLWCGLPACKSPSQIARPNRDSREQAGFVPEPARQFEHSPPVHAASPPRHKRNRPRTAQHPAKLQFTNAARTPRLRGRNTRGSDLTCGLGPHPSACTNAMALIAFNPGFDRRRT